MAQPREPRLANAARGDRETSKTSLGRRTATGCALVANLPTRTRRGPFERADGGRVVMGLHLHQHMACRLMAAVSAGLRGRAGSERLNRMPNHDCCVVGIGHHRVLRAQPMGVANHAKQTEVLGLTINGKGRVKNFVPAMLAVGLRKHHELDVRGVSRHVGEGVHQIAQLFACQGQPETLVGLFKRITSPAQNVDALHRRRRLCHTQLTEGILIEQDRLCHSVIQRCQHGSADVSAQCRRFFKYQLPLHHAFNACHI